MRSGRPHRLPREEYLGEKTVSFTACIWDREPLFLTNDIVDPQVQYLQRAMELGKCFVPIYCFMPDHLHVLFRGTDFDSDPLLAMERFKHFSGSWMQRNRLPRWQPGFHDTILRYGEWKRKVRYIAKNPVRAGLVENPFDFRSWALWART